MLSWARSQDPDDIRKRGFDWSGWMNADRTAIATSVITVDEGTVTIDDEDIAGAITHFTVTGGVSGETAVIRNRVTFDNGERKDQSARLRIKSA